MSLNVFAVIFFKHACNMSKENELLNARYSIVYVYGSPESWILNEKWQSMCCLAIPIARKSVLWQ